VRSGPATPRSAVALASPARTSSTICSTGEAVREQHGFAAALLRALGKQFEPRRSGMGRRRGAGIRRAAGGVGRSITRAPARGEATQFTVLATAFN
jgi:hypothetical protein